MHWITFVSCFCWAAAFPLACAASLIDADIASVLQVDAQVSHKAESNSDGSTAHANQSQKWPAFAVLLTTHNTEDKEIMYMEPLRWWLRKTKLPLFVVDSAGRGFPPSLSKIRSFKQLKFNQSDKMGDFVDSTLCELLSLERAWQAFQDDWSRFDYVVKVTGKYVLPDLQSEMKKVRRGNSFIIERYTDHKEAGYLWVNTEYLGFNAARMGDLLEEFANYEGSFELKLGQVLLTFWHPMQQLGSMMIPEQYRTPRANGDVLIAMLQTANDTKGHAVVQALK